MPSRPPDQIRLESEAGTLDVFNSLECVSDILAPAQCGFDVGDDGSFDTLADVVAHGKAFKVYLNDRLRLTGRVYVNEIPVDVTSGTTVNLVVRSILADAHYASADPKVRVQDTSIADFLVAIYAPLGLTRDDFIFDADLERDLMTGVPTKGGAAPADLEPIKLDAAKVNPPESIYEAASKHLKRFGLMHWDTPEGNVYVGAPDDQQRPLYRILCKRGAAAAANNVLSVKRIADWSDVPSQIRVFGGGGVKDVAQAPFGSSNQFTDVVQAGFVRPVLILNEGARSQVEVDAQARRERSKRSMRKDAYEITIDGWSYWDGSRAIPWAINTTADVDVDVIGGPQGLYFVHRVVCRYDTEGAPVTTVNVVGQGIWTV
jgi:prophage tail gpP-like protein